MRGKNAILGTLVIFAFFAGACGKPPQSKAALMATELRPVSCAELERVMNGTYDMFEPEGDGYVGRATITPIGSQAMGVTGDSPVPGKDIDRATLRTVNGSCAIRWFATSDSYHQTMPVAGISARGDIVLTGLQLQPAR